jgi:cytochrome c peroxidase
VTVPALALALAVRVVAGPQADTPTINYNATWWYSPGQTTPLARSATFDNPAGRLGVLHTSGPIATADHPFFAPRGTNGRACVTCHQPGAAMGLSVTLARARWDQTGGKDPLFAAIDGSNNPSLPQADRGSHSLLLNRGLIRVSLPWPERSGNQGPITPEFTIEVIRDPTGMNTDPEYGLTGRQQRISVFRRPRPVANMKYVMTPDARFNIKTGELMDTDPETGQPVGMNMMSDARHATLKLQAVAAALEHLERPTPLSDSDLSRIVEFEQQVFVAQSVDTRAMSLVEPGGPPGLGPVAMANGKTHVLGNKLYDQVFHSFDMWLAPGRTPADPIAAARASIARGNDVFMKRQFWIRDVTHMNTIGLGNPIKRTCVSCHNAQMSGQDLAPGWMDLGVNTYPTWTEPPTWTADSALPVFKVTCSPNAPPHPYLGRVIYTTDPGRALVSGRCADVGSIVMQQLRGLAARAPYFANGSASTLREVVDFYDRRFDMKLNEQEKQDLINFLGAL